jgi:hypothetical protein
MSFRNACYLVIQTTNRTRISTLPELYELIANILAGLFFSRTSSRSIIQTAVEPCSNFYVCGGKMQ